MTSGKIDAALMKGRTQLRRCVAEYAFARGGLRYRPAMMDDVTIDDAPLTSTHALVLIARLNAELEVRYPEPAANFFRLDPGEVSPGRGAFVIARVGGVAVACGGVRILDGVAPTTAEVKRMFVDPSARGRGIAGRVLEALRSRARSLGARRLVLETGARQHE